MDRQIVGLRAVPTAIAIMLFCVLVLIYPISSGRSQIEEEPAESAIAIPTADEVPSAAACEQVSYGKAGSSVSMSNENSSKLAASDPNPSGPTLADIGLFIYQIPAINEIDNHFAVNAFMDLVWCDPRLAYDSQKGPARKIYLEENAAELLTEIWWPDVDFVNEVAPRDIEDQEVIILPNGTVEYQEKFSVELEGRFDLRRFPFDKQLLEIEIESFAWTIDVLQLHAEPKKTGFSDKFELPEWHTAAVSTRIQQAQEIRDRAPFSEFIMEINVERLSGFYVWKVLLPLVLLVMVSWVTFWMTAIEIHDRMSISFTGLLTVVAYQFIATGNLPAIPYFTLMDGIISASFVLMVLSVFENLLIHILITSGRKEQALQLDTHCRWMFPGGYLLVVLIMLLIYV